MSEAHPFPCPTRLWHAKAQPSTLPTRPELSAKGKSVLVTGGGTGIGGETARYFAEAGASRIALVGRREKPLLDNKAFIEAKFPGVEVHTMPADVTKKGDVDAAFSQFYTGSGGKKIDVLVHAAAMAGPKEPVADVNGDEYIEAVRANVAGSLWVAQAFLRHAAPDAVVIAINAWISYLNVNEILAAYGAAKMAVYRLWDNLAFTNPNLSIFHTQPGLVLTELNMSVDGAEEFKGVPADDVSLPASFNVWLASPEAQFLKGKFVWCNWDVDELKEQAEEIKAGTKLNLVLGGWPFDDVCKMP